MHLGRPGKILSQNEKTYICFLRNVNLKYIYEINQVGTKFYVLSLYVVYHTPIEKFEDAKGVIRSVLVQELLCLPEHMCSSPVFSWVRVAQSLVFCRSLFVF
jgi:hypothetical protein